MNIQFNKPYLSGKEISYFSDAYALGRLAGDGHFTHKCQSWLENNVGCHRALLTHSCTAALEMAAILADIQPGDEVIMPSFTFVSTANAFVLRGAVPIFVDVRADTLNIDESLIEAAITPNTKAIVPVHYAGVACEMDTIMSIARKYNLLVIEDAAQAIMSTYKGRQLGSIGHLGCLSFHETKNISSGEGGALLINKSNLVSRAEKIRCKGTNRSDFDRQKVDKYTWVDIGSSYLPGDFVASILWAQMEMAVQITSMRLDIWNYYHQCLSELEELGKCRRPIITDGVSHNAHLYYLLLPSSKDRDKFISSMSALGISCPFHYVPLHQSPFYIDNYSSIVGSVNLPVTSSLSSRLVRLPIWLGVEDHLDFIIDSIKSLLLN